MNKKASWIIIILLVAASWEFLNSDLYPRWCLEQNINQLLKDNNDVRLRKIAANRRTYHFLRQLPADSRIQNISDSQGGSRRTLYFTGQIKQRDVSIYVKKQDLLVWQVSWIKEN